MKSALKNSNYTPAATWFRRQIVIQLVLVLLLAINTQKIYAQQSQSINGSVKDSLSGLALGGASVLLFPSNSLQQPIAAIATESGQFVIQVGNLNKGYLEISYAGYITKRIAWSKELGIHALHISLSPQISDEASAVVVGRRPPIGIKGDTIALNISAVAGGENSNASELMEQLPLTAKDANGNLQVKGQSPRILIDDKPVELRAEQLKDFLESLPGSMIERIELVQSPGGEFAAEGTAVINIVTNKSKAGLTARANVALGSIGEKIAGVNAGFKSGKWNSMFSASFRSRNINGDGQNLRSNYFIDSSNQLNSTDSFLNRTAPINIRWQADFAPNKSEQWSMVLNMNAVQNKGESETLFKQINNNDELWQLNERFGITSNKNLSFNPQLNYSYKGKKGGSSLRVNLQYILGNLESEQYFIQNNLDPKNDLEVWGRKGQLQKISGETSNLVGRVNYSIPIVKKRLSLSAGATYNSSTNPQKVETFTKQDVNSEDWEIVPNLSTSLRFRQDVSTIRLGQNLTLNKQWKIYAQLQYENTRFSTNGEDGRVIENNYQNWLPYLRIRKEWGKHLNSSLQYNQFIRRPSNNQLSPVVYINDPFNLRTGNPLLGPAITQQIEWNLQFTKGKSFTNHALSYSISKDIVQPIRLLTDTGVTITSYKNLANSTQYNYDFGWGISINKQWRLNTSGAVRYTTYPEEQRQQFRFQNGLSANGSLQLSWQYDLRWSANASMTYNRIASPQGVARSNIGNRFAVQHKFANRSLSLNITAIDPFTPQHQLVIVEGARFYSERFRTIRSRNYQVGLAWQFQKVMERKKSTGTGGKLLQDGAKITANMN